MYKKLNITANFVKGLVSTSRIYTSHTWGRTRCPGWIRVPLSVWHNSRKWTMDYCLNSVKGSSVTQSYADGDLIDRLTQWRFKAVLDISLPIWDYWQVPGHQTTTLQRGSGNEMKKYYRCLKMDITIHEPKASDGNWNCLVFFCKGKCECDCPFRLTEANPSKKPKHCSVRSSLSFILSRLFSKSWLFIDNS